MGDGQDKHLTLAATSADQLTYALVHVQSVTVRLASVTVLPINRHQVAVPLHRLSIHSAGRPSVILSNWSDGL